MLGLQKLLYPGLRPIEIEQLYEKAWFAITETCLAMTIFREEVGGWFIIMFVSLLIGKVWGWIGEGRVEVLEQQPPSNPSLFHARLSISLVMSILFDVFVMKYTIDTVRYQARPSMMVMFAFEFAVLSVGSISTLARYAISLREAAVVRHQTMLWIQERQSRSPRTPDGQVGEQAQSTSNPELDGTPAAEDIETRDIDVPGWEEKNNWIFYLDLVTGNVPLEKMDHHSNGLAVDFLKLVLYLTFFSVLCMFYGMPIHIIRDVALTIRSFYKRIGDYMRYRHATRDMNRQYPDATAEELSSNDVCIICRETMTPWQAANTHSQPRSDHQSTRVDERLRPKRLMCGHILHFGCLRSWMERQQNCPTCRQPVLRNPPSPQAAPPIVNEPPGIQGGNNAVREEVPPLAGNPRPGGRPNPMHVFTAGPFRLVFGARHNLRDLAQRPERPLPIRREPEVQNHLGSQEPVRNRDLPTAPSPLSPTALQPQLLTIEQQLGREINNLRLQADQLYLIRALQSELARLRSAHSYDTTIRVPSDGSRRDHTGASANLPIMQHPHSDDAHQELLGNLRCPEGWTILPLHGLAVDFVPTESMSPGRLQARPSRQDPAGMVNMTSSEENRHPSAVDSSTQSTDGNCDVSNDQRSPRFMPLDGRLFPPNHHENILSTANEPGPIRVSADDKTPYIAGEAEEDRTGNHTSGPISEHTLPAGLDISTSIDDSISSVTRDQVRLGKSRASIADERADNVQDSR